MTAERSPRVGLLALMLELYDQSNPDLKPNREGFAAELARLLGGSADVVYSGIRNTRGGVEAAVREFQAEDVDLVAIVCLSYSPSLISLPALLALRVPLVLLNTQELAGVGPDFGFDDLLRNHGMHGLHDLANVLNRMAVPYHVVTGHARDAVARQELADWVTAAYAARMVRSLRVGLVGHAFAGWATSGSMRRPSWAPSALRWSGSTRRSCSLCSRGHPRRRSPNSWPAIGSATR